MTHDASLSFVPPTPCVPNYARHRSPVYRKFYDLATPFIQESDIICPSAPRGRAPPTQMRIFPAKDSLQTRFFQRNRVPNHSGRHFHLQLPTSTARLAICRRHSHPISFPDRLPHEIAVRFHPTRYVPLKLVSRIVRCAPYSWKSPRWRH